MVATNSMLYGIAMESYSKNAHRGKSKLQTYLMDDPVIQTMEDLALLYTTPVFSFSLCRYTQPSLDTIVPPTAFHAATAVTTTNGYCNSKNSKRITHNDPAELRDDDEADHDDESISVSNTHPPDVPAFPTGMATKSSKAESSGIAVAKVAKKSSRRKFSKDRKRVSNISRSSEKTLKEAEIDWFQPGTCSKGVTARPAGRWQAQVYFAGASRYIGLYRNRDQANTAFHAFCEYLEPFRNDFHTKEQLAQIIEEGRNHAARVVQETYPSSNTRLDGTKKSRGLTSKQN